jgi:F0F1-type ATP synthase membrane subunit b/b'
MWDDRLAPVEDEPKRLGPYLAFVIERAKLLQEHDDSIQELHQKARMAYEARLRYEVSAVMREGHFTEPQAQQIATNELAYLRFELEEEVRRNVERLQSQLRMGLDRVLEELEMSGEGN